MKRAFFLISSLLILLSCEQPFRAGLGAVVDTRPPTVTLTLPSAGDYIWGKERLFFGSAEDDYKLEKVEFIVTNYPDERNPYREYTEVALKRNGPNKAEWEIPIDTTLFTTEFGDGDFKIRLKATDSAGKIAETDEIAFFIKNTPPLVTLAAPYVAENASSTTAGDIGQGPLNWGMAGMGEPLASAGPIRKMDKGSDISGTISYEEDLYKKDPEVDANGKEWYPPQIRIWRVGDGGFAPNYLPDTQEAPWQPLNLDPIGIGSYTFNFPVDEETGFFYGFEIRVLSKDGRSSFQYPRDFYEPNWTAAGGEEENRYVLFYLKVQSGFPTVSLYEQLENLSDFNAGITPPYYNFYTPDADNYTNPVNKIVSSVDVWKNGDFTLRYRASHSETILSAEIYWEHVESSLRGRFIWDEVPSDPDDLSSHATMRYSQWGTKAPAELEGDPSRNFVFTYRHGVWDGVPNNGNYHAAVRGMSRVQVFNGTDAEWEEGKKDNTKWANSDLPLAQWTGRQDLPEGTFKIEVYARSPYFSGTVNYKPYTNTVRLDLTAPTARIVTIEGAYDVNLTSTPPAAIVNGVIEPQLNFSDSRVLDSGLRLISNVYYPGGLITPSYEQRWVLVNDGDNKQLDTIIAASRIAGGSETYWPPVPNSNSDTLTLAPSVTAVKHGAVSESKFRLKTSKLYATGESDGSGPLDSLADGFYWLYVFVRDNAYNVGQITPLRIEVRADSDKPVIKPLSETITGEVTTPNMTVPAGDVGFEKVEGTTTTYRNRLSQGSNIRLELFDDDALATGTVTMTFTAAQAADQSGNNITALTGNYIVSLTESITEVKRTHEITIKQSDLVSAIKNNSTALAAYNTFGLFAPKGGQNAYTDTLPDGTYRLQISIGDHQPAKMKMENPWGTETANPAQASATITIWLFVDNDSTYPLIKIIDTDATTTGTSSPDGWIDPTGKLSSLGLSTGNDGVVLTGTLADCNGPITVSSFTITGEDGNGQGFFVNKDEVKIERVPSATSLDPGNVPYQTRMWYANFTAPVHISPATTTTGFVVTLEFKDRFGKTRTHVQKYQMDTEPPTVSLQKPIITFELPADVDRLNGVSADNLKRLANGVVFFNISATDNRRVKEVRWWLVKDGVTIPADLWGYTPSSTDGVYNAKTSGFSDTIYVDTTALDGGNRSDGVGVTYNLYLMAEDSAGKRSVAASTDIGSVPHLKQTIFIKQQEDAPFFQTKSDSSETVVDKSEMIVSFTITDDDGFFQNSALRNNTLRMWMSGDTSTSRGRGDRGTYNLTGANVGTWTGGLTTYVGPLELNPGTAVDGITIATTGSKTLTLTIDFNKITAPIFTGILAGDGKKHYIIEVTDSPDGKKTAAGLDDTGHTRSWREYYSMVLDSNPPTISLSAPMNTNDPSAAIPVFGDPTKHPASNPFNFEVTGTMSDAYLKKVAPPNNNYYFKLKRGTADLTIDGNPEYRLGTGPGNGFIAATPNPITDTVNFTIPSATFIAPNTGIDYGSLGYGYNTLTFIAEDQSGKTGSATLTFIKDTRAPEYRFISGITDTNKIKLPTINSKDWWAADANPTSGTNDYTAKRNIDLPIISHEGTEAPAITGTFTDEYSNIDLTSFKIKFDGGNEITIPAAQITGGLGKNVNWTVYLTKDGKPSTTLADFLIDGVHSIQIVSVKDDKGNELTDNDVYGFRVISATPTSTINKTALTRTVYGDRAGANPNTTTVFTITGTANGFNLNANPVELIIRYTDPVTSGSAPPQTVTVPVGAWSYAVTPHPASAANAPPSGTGREQVAETNTWSFTVTRGHILAAGGQPDNNTSVMRAGNYEIAAIAIDRSIPTAKRSEEVTANVWQFVIDSTKPTFTFNFVEYPGYPSAQAQLTTPILVTNNQNFTPSSWLANLNERNVITDDTDPRIKGRVSDDNNTLADVQLQISKWNYTAANQTDGSAWQMWNKGTPGNNGSWVAWSASADDAYWVPLDPDASDTDPMIRTVNYALSTFPDGYYRVRLRARDSSTATTVSTGWTTANDGNPAYSPYAFFFLDRNIPTVTPDDVETHFSSRYKTGNNLSFRITALSDANMLEKLAVQVEAVNTNAVTLPTVADDITMRSGSGSWPNRTVTIPFNPDNLPDGIYKITYTATDLAGRTATASSTITLDNASPTATVTDPRETQIGGEPVSIAGSANDQGINGSASGLAYNEGYAGIWYRIGYGSQTALPAFVAGESAAARSAKIMAWAATTDSGLAGVPTTGDRDTGSAYNTNFNTASRSSATNSLWFKYVAPGLNADGNTYDKPLGFTDITSMQAQDLYSWFLNADNTVVEAYSTGPVTMRGATYNSSSARRLALVPEGQSDYSLPLVVRVVDKAGNVFYELHDIKLNPDADIPESVINNPSERFYGMGSPRGGQMQINGVAKDNTSIRKVIYRVKVDNTQNTGEGSNPTSNTLLVKTGGNYPAGNGGIVIIPGANRWQDDGEYNGTAITSMLGRWNSYGTNGSNVNEASGTGALNKDGWYVANLESPHSATSPWNFMLNTSGEITDLIRSKGFEYPVSGSPNTDGSLNNMIRVWVEVLVFDDLNGDPYVPAYNKMSKGDNNNGANPRPYVREFYFTTSAPSVAEKKISALGETNASGVTATFDDYTSPQAENNVRGGRFAIQAKLDGNGPIGEIQIRLPVRAGETETDHTGWTTIYDGTTVTHLAGLKLGTTAGADDFTGGNTAFLTFSFDSTLTSDNSSTSAAPLRSVRNGTWATTGGTFTVEVNVYDAANPRGTDSYTFEIGVDNFAPLADRVTKKTPGKVAGSNVLFLGRVFDYQGSSAAENTMSPPHRGIKEVRVWFTSRDGTQYINLTNGNRVSSVTTDTITAMQNRNYNVAYPSDTVTNIVVAPPALPAETSGTITYPSDANYVRVINSFSAQPGSGMSWGPSTNGADIYWILEQSTIGWTDGWTKLHYVVVDNADNASYYYQEMIVMNNTPQITKVTLNTNNTGSGAVFTREGQEEHIIPTTPYPIGYLKTDFISKNNVIGFDVETLLGKGTEPLNYEAFYVERYRVPLTETNLTAMAARAASPTATNTLTYIDDSGDNQTLAVSSFVNLYTIAPGYSNAIMPDTWKLFGVPSTPSDGSHFVFTAKAADVSGMAAYSGVYVYAYRERKATGNKQRGPSAAPTSTPDAYSIPASALNFDGTDYFNGDGKINEARAEDDTNAYYAAGYPDAASKGTAFFLIKVYDTVAADLPVDERLYDAIVIGMKVYVGDRRPPFARLYDLNPYLENAVVGNNITVSDQAETLSDAAAPTAIGANIKRGGLYNTGTERAPIKSGYIDPRFGTTEADGSTALYPYANYPDDPLSPYTNSRQERPDNWVETDMVGTGTASNDKVSGKILLRGLAWDDQLIDEIQINIGGTSKTILQLTDQMDGSKRMQAPSGVQAWAYEEIHWQTGHTVEWAYLWDTAAEPTGRTGGGPRTGIAVSVIVLDKNGGLLTPNPAATPPRPAITVAQEDPNAAVPLFHNTVTVDIVPYITGFERETPKFSTKRSRQGWYSFYRGEENIAVNGFNLGGSGNLTMSMIYGDTSSDTKSITVTGYTSTPTGTPARHRFTIPAGADSNNRIPSGKINGTVNVNSVSADIHNHTSIHTNKSWNREYNRYVTGSDLWVNKPYAHIWDTDGTDFQDDIGGTGSAGLDSPGMALEYSGANPGRLHGAWSVFANEGFYYGTNTATAATTLWNTTQGEPFKGPDIGMYNGTGTPNVITTFQQDGRPSIMLSSLMNQNQPTYIAPNTATGFPSNRWQNIRISKAAENAVGTSQDHVTGRAYVTSYDAYNKSMWFNMRYDNGSAATFTLTQANNGTAITTNNYLRNTYVAENAVVTAGTLIYRVGAQARGTTTNTTDIYAPISGTITGIQQPTATGNFARLPNYDANAGYGIAFTISGGGHTNLTTVLDGPGAANATGASTNAGQYSAVDYDSTGPIVAYYDQQKDTVRIAFGTLTGDLGETNSIAWTRHELLPTSHRLYSGSGQYISMKVDRRGGIHLAFFNSINNTVVYAYASGRGVLNGSSAPTPQAGKDGSGNPNNFVYGTTPFYVCTIDNIVRGGQWTDISVDNRGNPMIVYGDSSRIGNNDGIRIAYLLHTQSPSTDSYPGLAQNALQRSDWEQLYCPVTGANIKGWEALTMPANHAVRDDRFNIEVWPPTNRAVTTTGENDTGTLGTAPGWSAAVGYASDRFRVGYFFYPTWKGY